MNRTAYRAACPHCPTAVRVARDPWGGYRTEITDGGGYFPIGRGNLDEETARTGADRAMDRHQIMSATRTRVAHQTYDLTTHSGDRYQIRKTDLGWAVVDSRGRHVADAPTLSDATASVA